MWGGVELAIRSVIQLTVLAVLARLLEPSDFGLVAIVTAFSGVGLILMDSGLSAALIQRQVRSDDAQSTIFFFNLGIAILLMGALWFSAPLVAEFYSSPEFVPIVRLASLLFLFGALAAVPDAILAMQLDFRTRARIELFSSLIAGIIAVSLAWKGFGAWSLITQMLVAAVLRAIALWVLTRWRPRGRFQIDVLRDLGGFGSYLMLAGILDVFSLRVQALILGRAFGTATAGLYNIAQTVQQMPASFLVALCNRVGLPIFSKGSADRASIRSALRKALSYANFIYLPILLTLAFSGTVLIETLFGAQWRPAGPVLSILAIAGSMHPFHALNLVALKARGHSNVFFRLEVIKSLISIGLVLNAAWFGPVFVALAVLVSSTASLYLNTRYSKSELHYGIIAQLRDQRFSIILAAGAGALFWMGCLLAPNNVLFVLALTPIIAAAYIIAAALLKHPAYLGIRRLLADLI